LLINTNRDYLNIWPLYKVFGNTFVYFKPLVVLPVVAWSIYLLKYGKSTDLRYKWVKYTFVVPPVAFVFIFVGLFSYNFNDLQAEKELELTFTEINDFVEPELRTSEGNQVLLFVSLSCSHCYETTRMLAAMKRKYPSLNVRLMLFNDEGVEKFQSFANADFEHSVIEAEGFIKVTDGRVPAILNIKDGEIDKHWDGKSFNYAALNYLQSLQQ